MRVVRNALRSLVCIIETMKAVLCSFRLCCAGTKENYLREYILCIKIETVLYPLRLCRIQRFRGNVYDGKIERRKLFCIIHLD